MNIALVLQHKLLLGVRRLLSGMPALAAQTPAWPSIHALPSMALCKTIPLSSEAQATSAVSPTARKVMPLRVLRVVEKGQPRSCTGRLVISGRMVDVCAELDRLVAREATMH